MRGEANSRSGFARTVPYNYLLRIEFWPRINQFSKIRPTRLSTNVNHPFEPNSGHSFTSNIVHALPLVSFFNLPALVSPGALTARQFVKTGFPCL
ncbi:hypothetical protein I7I48_04191 [Histoplasma ohiense]|nr:hypothetical protein I7I48_04191 [Histoplasma ohiense (nom. inval.)]